MYVPLLQSLQTLLSNEVCLSEVSTTFATQNFHMHYNRLSEDTEVSLLSLRIIVMEKVSQSTLSFQYITVPYKYSCILMKLNCVMHLVLKLRSINWVCTLLDTSVVRVFLNYLV